MCVMVIVWSLRCLLLNLMVGILVKLLNFLLRRFWNGLIICLRCWVKSSKRLWCVFCVRLRNDLFFWIVLVLNILCCCVIWVVFLVVNCSVFVWYCKLVLVWWVCCMCWMSFWLGFIREIMLGFLRCLSGCGILVILLLWLSMMRMLFCLWIMLLIWV